MTAFVHTPTEIIPLVNAFKSTIRGQDSVSRTIRGQVELLQAELHGEMRQVELASQLAEAAEASFKSSGCAVDFIDVELFRATLQDIVESSEVLSIYQKFHSRNDIARCRRLRILRLPTPTTRESLGAEWPLRQRRFPKPRQRGRRHHCFPPVGPTQVRCGFSCGRSPASGRVCLDVRQGPQYRPGNTGIL